jgi:hypothetical protein
MNSDPNAIRDFDLLLEKLCEDQLDDSERARLEEYLRRGEPWRQRYLSYVDLHATLWLIGSDPTALDAGRGRKRDAARSVVPFFPAVSDTGLTHPAQPPAPGIGAPPTQNPQIGSHSPPLGFFEGLAGDAFTFFTTPFALGLLALVFVLGGVTGIWWIGRGAPEAQVRVAMAEQLATPVAYLTLANGCDWGRNASQVQAVGSAVKLGDEITLHEGIAEFRLSSGVSLSFEGPAALVITSPTSLILQHGKATVHVPWAVTDFNMLAGPCRINASEAEFGVRVIGGEIGIHAFIGQVLAAPAFEGESVDEHDAEPKICDEAGLASGSEFSKVVIAAGRGLALANQSNVTKVTGWHTAEAAAFATKLPMAGGLPITPAYVNAVVASKPMDYWRFEERKGDLVSNEIVGGSELKIVGDVRFVGSSSNRAIELGRPGSDGFLLSKNAIDRLVGPEYSVELWVKPSHLHDGSPISLATHLPSEERERHAFYLQLCGPSQKYPANMRNRVRFLHRDPPSVSSATGTSCYSSDLYLVRRWQHVVAVKNATQLRLYVDGELTATEHDESSLAANLDLIVGQAGPRRRIHPFIGQLDELAIYDRALSHEELMNHCKAVQEDRPIKPPRDS